VSIIYAVSIILSLAAVRNPLMKTLPMSLRDAMIGIIQWNSFSFVHAILVGNAHKDLSEPGGIDSVPRWGA